MNADTELAFFCLLVKQGESCGDRAGIEPDLPAGGLLPPVATGGAPGVRLLNRTTRCISLTGEGARSILESALRISDIDEMERLVSSSRRRRKGCCGQCAARFRPFLHRPGDLGFTKTYPDVETQLHLTDRPISSPDEAIDVSIRFWRAARPTPDRQKIAANRRLLCARRPTCELRRRPAGLIRTTSRSTSASCARTNRPTATGALSRGGQTETMAVRRQAEHQRREVALNWRWRARHPDARRVGRARYLRSGRLVQLLADYAPRRRPTCMRSISNGSTCRPGWPISSSTCATSLSCHADSPQHNQSNW